MSIMVHGIVYYYTVRYSGYVTYHIIASVFCCTEKSQVEVCQTGVIELCLYVVL